MVAVALAGAQQTSSLSTEDAESAGLNFSLASGWQGRSFDPYSATAYLNGTAILFATEMYSAPSQGSFDTKTTDDVLRGKWGESLKGTLSKDIHAASATGVEVEWTGSRVERWFRLSNDRFLVERCMTNSVKLSVWSAVVRPACDAQFNAVVVTASTLPPSYRAEEAAAAENVPPPENPVAPREAKPELVRIPGGKCRAASGASETARAASLVRHGERAETPADQFACWESASQLGSADAMTKIGQMFLDRDQLHQSEQDRTAGVVWLLVAADRYQALMRTASDA